MSKSELKLRKDDIIELKKKSSDELIEYFNKENVSIYSLTEFLKSNNIPISSYLNSRKKIIEFASNSISGLGMFQRISKTE